MTETLPILTGDLPAVLMEDAAPPGTAAEIAQTALANQTVAEPGTTIRVRVWEGTDADTSAEPAHTLISEEIGS